MTAWWQNLINQFIFSIYCNKEVVFTTIRNYFNNFISLVKNNVYIIVCEDKKIGFYNGELLDNGNYEIGNICILPEYQGKGIGKQIVQTLEKDEYFLRAKRIEIPASITAVGFYKKMGYDYKNGIAELDDEQLYRMEKFR